MSWVPLDLCHNPVRRALPVSFLLLPLLVQSLCKDDELSLRGGPGLRQVLTLKAGRFSSGESNTKAHLPGGKDGGSGFREVMWPPPHGCWAHDSAMVTDGMRRPYHLLGLASLTSRQGMLAGHPFPSSFLLNIFI